MYSPEAADQLPWLGTRPKGHAARMSLAKKLNLKADTKVRVVGKPNGVDLGDVLVTSSAKADAIVLFVTTLDGLDDACRPVVEAAKADRIAWVAFPKTGRLGTDLNRDVLGRYMRKYAIQGVRQIAVDEVWSAMRFRPEK
jgi:hypothetical protein